MTSKEDQQEDPMKHRSFRKRRRLALTGGVAISVVVAAMSLLGSPAAASGLVTVACAGSDSATFNPGLRNFAQTVSFAETLEAHGCTGLGKISGDNAFETSFGGTQEFSCTTLHVPPAFTLQVTWSPSGRTSTWNSTSTVVTYANGQVISTSTGQITGGDYTGATLTAVGVYPSSQLAACLSAPGLTSISGTMTWTFVDL
jgi:hypothetical protein